MLTQLLLLAQTTHIWDKQPGDGQAGGDLERHAAVQHNGFICVGPQVLHWEHRQAHELTSAHALPEVTVLLCWLQGWADVPLGRCAQRGTMGEKCEIVVVKSCLLDQFSSLQSHYNTEHTSIPKATAPNV